MVEKTFDVQNYTADPSDVLYAEHQLLLAWTRAALSSLSRHEYYKDVDLKSVPEGRAILEAPPEQLVRLFRATLQQLAHCEIQVAGVRGQAKSDTDQWNPHILPGWDKAWGTRRQVRSVLNVLLRRSLMLGQEDLIALIDFIIATPVTSLFDIPIGTVVKTIERHLPGKSAPPALRQRIMDLKTHLRKKDDKSIGPLLMKLDILAPESADETSLSADRNTATPSKGRPLKPNSSGNPNVLTQFKVALGLLENSEAFSERLEPDEFPLLASSPLRAQHDLISAHLHAAIATNRYYNLALEKTEPGSQILRNSPRDLGLFILAAAERDVAATLQGYSHSDGHTILQSRYAANNMANRLLTHPGEFDRDGLFDLTLYLATRPNQPLPIPWTDFLRQLHAHDVQAPLTEGERYTLHLYRESRIGRPLLGQIPPDIASLNSLIGDDAGYYLTPGERWSDDLNADLHAAKATQRESWIALLRHWMTATASRPSPKWHKQAAALVKAVGPNAVVDRCIDWLSKLPSGRAYSKSGSYPGDTRGTADVVQVDNANCLRGMLWTLPSLKSRRDEVLRVVAAVTLSAYRKVPGVGPRAVKVGNAGVYALSEFASADAVGQLAMLKVRVKFGTAQKEIEKAFNSAAEALGLPRDQIEELGVPTYGLEEVGIRKDNFGDATATLSIDGSDVSIQWTSAGKPVKSVPAKVKTEFKDDLKELQSATKDIAGMLPAQAARLDSMFLLQKRWPVAHWRERYINHPLVGTLARRLIWSHEDRSFIWMNDGLVDIRDRPVVLQDGAEISLWHPIDRPTDEVLAWRAALLRHEIKQPFKQAHRELYVLTDAERRTSTYSNRFAAHILRQHQFNALCSARGWKNRLRLMVDDTYPPAQRDLPHWGLRAEYWVEGIGDNYGTDTNESGVYLRLVSDQVRFYRTGAAQNYAHAGGGGYTTNAPGPGAENSNEPLRLDQVPPLVLSEVLRDVDLFVGVASVGNDPTWQDGGPEGRYRTYWHTYSFGDLSESAKTRKAVLETLLPRLTKLNGKWSISDKFLIVRGSLRTYKIHLGSGNILMEPNDQYLCIVPNRSTKADDKLFLPFEGDGTLSVILSKAFLLADDTNIKDPTITRQIQS